jgi:hypothetical protein
MFKQARRRTQTSTATSLPAMTGGWNARDPLPMMKEEYAVVLDNFFPGTGSVDMRRGSALHASGVGSGPVEVLMEYSSGSTRKLLAAGGGGLYDATTPGAATALVLTYQAADWIWTNFRGFLVAANGTDIPFRYDGATVTECIITGSGLSGSNLNYVLAHKSRLFLVEKDTLSFWYLSTNAVQGAALEFDLSGIFRLGGELVALGSWTRDGGSGSDDLLVAITSRGEVAVYQGSDPSSANDWALVGVFRISAPMGRRCLMKYGADLAVLTQDGVLPLSQVLPIDRSSADSRSISDRIKGAFTSAARTYGMGFTWQVHDYPKANWLFVNVPVPSGDVAHQYVMNTLTGAWCRFKGMEAYGWGLLGDDLYYGGDNGYVYRADVGFTDDGATITGDAWGAFSYFGARGRLKQFKLIRPILTTIGNPSIAVGIVTDYDDTVPSGAVTLSSTTPLWDTVYWDESLWASESTIIRDWVGVSAIGTAAAVRLRMTTGGSTVDDSELEYLAKEDGTAILLEDGGLVVAEADPSILSASGSRVLVNDVPIGLNAFDVVYGAGGIV